MWRLWHYKEKTIIQLAIFMITTILSCLISFSLASSANQMMETAEMHMNAGQAELAIQYFEMALQTGDLNDFAKITAYWNLHATYDSLAQYDNAAENLLYFIISTEDMISYIDKSKHPAYIAFVAQTNLKNRLKYAKALIEIYWLGHNPSNCKTEQSACVLPMDSLLALYQFKIPFCGSISNIKGNKKENKNGILNLKVECESGIENYYFK